MVNLPSIAIGFGLCGLLVLVLEWLPNRRRRHRQRGNYFDARSPFRIVRRGPEPYVERSEELIARTARRLMRLRDRQKDSLST